MRRGAALIAASILSAAPAAGPAQQTPVFRSIGELVPVYVSVSNGGRPVSGLRAPDFVVYDNGIRQTIEEVQTGSVPADTTLFLGTGGTMRGLLASLNADLKTIASRLRPFDRVRLMTYDTQVTEAFSWRDSANLGAIAEVGSGNIQALYDACFLALMHRPEVGRRHLIVLITDGVEHGSVVDSTTVLNTARRSDAILHLFLVDSAPTHSAGSAVELQAKWYQVMPDVLGASRLQESSTITGGLVRRIDPKSHVIDAFDRAFSELNESYVLYFTPTGVAQAGWHDLRVEIPGVRHSELRARKGYAGG